jgi:hypothetical protein
VQVKEVGEEPGRSQASANISLCGEPRQRIAP